MQAHPIHIVWFGLLPEAVVAVCNCAVVRLCKCASVQVCAVCGVQCTRCSLPASHPLLLLQSVAIRVASGKSVCTDNIRISTISSSCCRGFPRIACCNLLTNCQHNSLADICPGDSAHNYSAIYLMALWQLYVYLQSEEERVTNTGEVTPRSLSLIIIDIAKIIHQKEHSFKYKHPSALPRSVFMINTTTSF